MLVVEAIAKIRRGGFAQNKPIKTICREFRVSRRVVRKIIRSQAIEFRYQRSRQPLPRIDPWRDQLEGLLLENEGKPARERLTLIRIFEELRALGYEGSYDAVRRYARVWRQARGSATAQAYVPLSFAPGERTLTEIMHAEWLKRVGIGANLLGSGVDDPDAYFYEHYACGSERNYTNYCSPEPEKMYEQQSIVTDQGKS